MRSLPLPTAITHTRIVDGTGGPEYLGDVVLEAGRISKILPAGAFKDTSGGTHIIDGAGLITCPGFIDMHGGSGFQFVEDSLRHSKTSQGVTTEVIGHDVLYYQAVKGSNFFPTDEQLERWTDSLQTSNAPFPGVANYLERLESGIGTNTLVLLPHSALRFHMQGLDINEPTEQQLNSMADALGEALKQGAVGLASGFDLCPLPTPTYEELKTLCTVLANHGAFYSPAPAADGIDSLARYSELFELARETSVGLHLTHVAPIYTEDKELLSELLQLFDASLDSNIDLTIDTFPYVSNALPLATFLPRWARTGTVEEISRNLDDEEILARIRQELESPQSLQIDALPIEWEDLVVYSVEDTQLRVLINQSIATIARIQRVEPFTVFCNILTADSLATTVLHNVGREEDIVDLINHRTHIGASASNFKKARPHPSTYGAFPRFISHFAQDSSAIGLCEIINHLTGRPAARLKLAQRGEIREGYAADLVIFDPDSIMDMSSFKDPTEVAAGINYVLVNGVLMVDQRQLTDEHAGRALRRDADGLTRAL